MPKPRLAFSTLFKTVSNQFASIYIEIQPPFDGDFMHIDQGKAETKTKQCQRQENQ